MNMSEQINELATALALAQIELENASKNAANPHFKSKYADLAEVLNTVRPVFAKHGLSVTQFPSYAEGLVSVRTVLMHKSGQWMAGDASAPATKLDAQGVGSAITYLRRYSLAAVAGVAQEDDDANAAVKPANNGNYKDTRGVSQSNLISYEKALQLLDGCMDLAAVERVSTQINDSWNHFTNPQRTDLRTKKNEVINALTPKDVA